MADAYGLVSVIVATRDRPRLLSVALECYRHQTYRPLELIVIDDGHEFPVDESTVAAVGGRLLRAEPGTPLGVKLNQGISVAHGVLCQKMDDDDWYAPTFIETMVESYTHRSTIVCVPAVVACAYFLFFDLSRWEIREGRENTLAGATLLFALEDWRERPFRGVARDEDVWFVKDQLALGLSIVAAPVTDLYLAVRHAQSIGDRGHTWTHQPGDRTVEAALQDQPIYAKRPEDMLPSWALEVYRDLQRDSTSAREEPVG